MAGSTTREEKLSIISNAGIAPHLIKLSSSDSIAMDKDFFSVDVLIICIPPNRKSGGTEEYHRQLERVVDILKATITRNVVFISSTSVYPDTNGVVTEIDASDDSYLVKAERLLQTHPLKTTVIRFGGLFGPGRHPGKFLAGKANVSGGKNPVNMIHLNDCIGIIKTIIRQKAWGEVYNACANSHPTRNDFYSAMAKQTGLEPPSFSNDKSPFKIVSSEKLIRELKYDFLVSDLLAWKA